MTSMGADAKAYEISLYVLAFALHTVARSR
jgi:hypothetical protein